VSTTVGWRWRDRVLLHPSVLGLAVGLLGAWVSLSPTLLPRTWYFQGVVTGLAMTLGYGIGVAAQRVLLAAAQPLLVRRGWERRPWTRATEVRVRRVALLVIVLGAVQVAAVAVREHSWTWDRLGYDPGSRVWAYVGTFALALAIATVLIVVAHLLRLAWKVLHRAGRVVLPSWLAALVALAMVAGGLLAALDTYVFQRTLAAVNEAYALADGQVDLDADPPPTSVRRSAGPASSLTFASLGREGRAFVTRGPTAARLAAFHPQRLNGPVVEPIRAFVGRADSDDPAERAATAVAELTRLGAWERSAILVVLPTGTGWVNEQVVQPVEYLLHGDVATVATQYSHLPSPLAFLGERTTARAAGRALLAAVEAELARRPAPRPLLLVAGESLGAYGLQTAYADLDDLVARTDGALFVGSPALAPLRQEAEAVRQPGSRQVRPVVGDGRRIVFANRDSDLRAPGAEAVFLQQPDDGVVWWDPDTAFRRPDWLREPRDPSVNPEMEWRPLVTFLNLAVDMAVSNDFDEGNGHRYGTLPTVAWERMLRPVLDRRLTAVDAAPWDPAAVERLRDRLARVER